MSPKLTWEEETRARIERAKTERKKAQTNLEHWTSRLQVLEEALRLETIGLMPPEQRKDLASMSIISALVELAKGHGGFVVTKDAIGVLTKAGVFFTRGEANDTIHTTLRRSKQFRRERPGVYRLVVAESSNYPAKPAQSLTDIVRKLEQEHPAWAHEDLVKAIIAMGYDFRGKKPGLAVNMARHRLAHASEPQPQLQEQSQAPLLPPV